MRKFKGANYECVTKEDYAIFDGKPKKTMTRPCVKTGDLVRCNANCVVCPYELAETELKGGQNGKTP